MSVEKTELYRHFDKNKTLLYVGVSLSCAARLAQHRDHAHWFKDVDSVTIERFSTRREALEAEKIAVVSENPKCNIQLKKTIAEIARENKRLQTENCQFQCLLSTHRGSPSFWNEFNRTKSPYKRGKSIIF
jgi:predicted GIY-YIG superfamily endonuclease